MDKYIKTIYSCVYEVNKQWFHDVFFEDSPHIKWVEISWFEWKWFPNKLPSQIPHQDSQFCKICLSYENNRFDKQVAEKTISWLQSLLSN